MKLCSNAEVEIRRCRPLLGTFVEIAARGRNDVDLERAIEAAFRVIEKIHRLMSFHDQRSDVSRMNRDAFPRGLTVHPWTWRVMKSAREFALASHATFDITVAPHLARWAYLPRHGYPFQAGANSRDIVLRKNCEIFFRRRVIVDLGGIAKGFAVDRGVAALKKNGATGGVVNAGGDLRVFGSTSEIVYLRHPADPTRPAGAVKLRQRAMATSGIYFEQRRVRGAIVSPLLDGRTGRCCRKPISVTVAAADCMTADALTKIVLALREEAAPVLARYRADALLLERDGSPSWRFQSPCDTRDQTQSD